MRPYLPIIGSLLLAASAFAGYQYPIGEKAVYKIQWGPLTCGTSTIRCDKVMEDNREYIRIRVTVTSNWLVSKLYPVDNTVDCFIDPETQQSVRVEKNTSEGGKFCHDVLTINRKTNRAEWISYSDNISTNYSIEAGACDAVSFAYSFRKHDFSPGESKGFSLVVDTALHGIRVEAVNRKPKKKRIGEGEKTECREYRVIPERNDLFVRKIPQSIWLTNDDRKILARMDIATPAGKARVILHEYTPPQ